MSPIDKQVITKKAKRIENDLAKLKEFKDVSFSEYEQNLEIRLQVERLLERILGRVIDINYHILKSEFDIIPDDYFASFIQLGKKGVIEKSFAEVLSQSTGLRNALAHEYDGIDDSLVHAAISDCLTQIPHYLEKVLAKYS